MAEPKTRPSGGSISEFLASIEDREQRADCRRIARMMRAATGKRPRLWGSNIVGYDSYDYAYASGRTGSWPITAYSPRARNISIYIMPGFSDFGSILAKLGKHKTGKSCLYLNRLADVDEAALAELIEASVAEMRRRYPG